MTSYRPAPPIVPVELIGTKFQCQRCSSQYEIDWCQQLKWPQEPIEPNEGGGHWVPVSFPQTCNCGAKTLVNVPSRKTTASWNLYGDEAARDLLGGLPGRRGQRAYFYCITLVGFSGSIAGRVKGRLRGLKRRAKRGQDPDDWALHATEIFSDTNGRNGITLRDGGEKAEWFHDVCKLIREAQPHRVLHNVSGVALETEEMEWRTVVDFMKNELHQIALLASLQSMVDQGHRPLWHFERTQKPEDGEPWAERAFLGLRHMPLFTWLSAGNAIHPPRFLGKGEHPYLELADFASFVIAREFFRRANHQEVEIPSAELGTGFYQAINQGGGIEREWSDGLPESFYPFDADAHVQLTPKTAPARS